VFVTPWRRGSLFAAALIAAALICSTVAHAGVQMSTGIRYVVPTGTVAECSTKAQTALAAYLGTPTEKTPGSGEWMAYGAVGKSGTPQSSAVVRCNAVDTGYVVTFTCAVQMPGSPYASDALCLDIAHNFSGKAVQPLATPTPVPSGCSTINLVGTWVSDGNSSLTLKMDANGNLVDSDGVSGNWILTGNTATLTYYGNKTVKLSPDGKHLTGSGLSFTRKC
jgi:hypothetical protein